MSELAGLSDAAAKTLAVWHKAVEKRDASLLDDITSEAMVFRSPAVYSPYPGREAFRIVIETVLTVFENFRYHRQFASSDGSSVVLEFEADIGDRNLKGIDMIRFDSDGKIVEFEVMVRPLSGLMALAEKMAERAGPKLQAARVG